MPTTTEPLHRRKLALPGTVLAYHVVRPEVRGVPVVLLHPWFGCWQFWSSTVRDLADRPSYLVDLYSPADGDWQAVVGPEALAEAVIRLLDAEGLDTVDLAGNSLGGIVAQLVAATVPGRVRRLVLVGTGASTTGTRPGFAAAVDRWIGAARAGGPVPRSIVEDTISMLVSSRPTGREWETYVQAVVRTDSAYLAAALDAARRLDLTSRLAEITADTLVVRGSEDCARTAEHAAALVSSIPKARAVEMPGAGHSPMVDHPAEFSALLRAHLVARPRPN